MFQRVHHVGIAVRDMDAALALYERAAGGRLIERAPSPDGALELAMLALGDTLIEPIAPLREGTEIGKFLDRRGEGLHHIAYEVERVAAELARLKKEGFRALDEAPRPGFGGTRIAFLHPKSALGVLWELVEVPKV